MSHNIKELVKQRYTEAVETTNESSCCAPSCCSPAGSALDFTFSESYDQQAGYVPDADYGLGCGIPTEHAQIQAGHTVLDLGSGAGNDVFVARQLVGETGAVIGLDMTEAMIEKANENKAKLGYENVTFVLGDIEAMPMENDQIDVAISNCVMNLVPNKAKAYQEVYRVLKPGGHFSISDVVIEGTLSPAVRTAAELYVGCIAGALDREDYLAQIEAAGFQQIEVRKSREIELPDDLLLQHLSAEEVKHLRASGTRVISVTVFARK